MAAKKKPVNEAPSPEVIQELKSALTPPDLEARVQQLEQQIQAVLILTQGVVLNGYQVPRCACKKLATRTLVWTHPSTGQRSFELCDACQPDHPLIQYPGSKVVNTARFTGSDLARIRQLNQVLSCVPSL